MAVELTPEFTVRAGLYRGRTPALMFHDGADEWVMVSGPRAQDAYLAKEFAFYFIGAAVRFAGLCNEQINRHEAWPEDDPETIYPLLAERPTTLPTTPRRRERLLCL